MLVSHDHSERNLEDVLRSLGALLDARLAGSILIKEVDAGLVVRARISPTLEQRLEGTPVPLERVFTSQDILEQQLAGIARRGTGHVAGPIERALRQIGRMADERQLSGVTLIQHDTEGGWLLWHEAITDGRPQLLTLTNGEIEDLNAAVTPPRDSDDELLGAPELASV